MRTSMGTKIFYRAFKLCASQSKWYGACEIVIANDIAICYISSVGRHLVKLFTQKAIECHKSSNLQQKLASRLEPWMRLPSVALHMHVVSISYFFPCCENMLIILNSLIPTAILTSLSENKYHFAYACMFFEKKPPLFYYRP